MRPRHTSRHMIAAVALAAMTALPLAAQSGEVPPLQLEPTVTGTDVDVLIPPTEPVTPAVVTRERFEVERDLSFADVPGGIVLGLAARPAPGLPLPRSIERRSDGSIVVLTEDGAELALPRANPALVRSALAFAQRGAGHWLVDVDAAGTVLLARELVDTPAGVVAVSADLAPLFFIPVDVGVKSSLFDNDVRLVADAGGRLHFETDLELRFYRPARRNGETSGAMDGDAERVSSAVFRHAGRDERGRARLAAPRKLERAGTLLAAHLADLADLAGWIAFFRWGVATELPGLAELETRLAVEPREPVSTPRRVDDRDRAAWVRGAGPAPSAEIPEWMQEWARERGGR